MISFRLCYTFNSSANEWKTFPKLITVRSGFSGTILSKSGSFFVVGGIGYRNVIVNSTEILEIPKKDKEPKWMKGHIFVNSN